MWLFVNENYGQIIIKYAILNMRCIKAVIPTIRGTRNETREITLVFFESLFYNMYIFS